MEFKHPMTLLRRGRQDLVKEPKTQGNGTVRKQSIQQTKKLQRGAEHNTRKTQNGKNLSYAEVSHRQASSLPGGPWNDDDDVCVSRGD